VYDPISDRFIEVDNRELEPPAAASSDDADEQSRNT